MKAVVSVATLYIVSHSIDWEDVGNMLKGAHYSLMLFALILFWSAQIISALRYKYIARVLGGSIDLPISLRAHFIGLWFNQVMPTSLGGDVVKMALLRKQLGWSVSIRSAILDRLSGLLFLLLVTAIVLPLYANLFSSNIELVYALGVMALGGMLVIVIGSWLAHCIISSTSLNPFFYNFIKIFSDVWSFKKGGYLWEQTWTSSIVHFNGIITYMLLGLAIGVDADFVTFLLVVPIIILIALIPVSFAGWGLREAGAVWLFGIVGISNESALAMSISFGLLLVVAGLPGLLIFSKYISSSVK
ncbi:lysylphosphatidylglycerol synthase transmembrane domain-containing protein [Solemya velesiana gill symbiont]|uniref:lysylphosphatidylglycerol synthase transmembrane domain-containing protein n=1 Tax=Solemya velesiana gill symbiont TaxID=1918948 RepID=UPI001560C781|nr:lysylphosphatidylglycerol synthase transmembrane domain-containing protein [Solemya velesiana gill symbiont]